jgi:hypothetical protein
MPYICHINIDVLVTFYQYLTCNTFSIIQHMKTLIPYLLYVNKIKKRSEIGMAFCHSWNLRLSIYILILRFRLIQLNEYETAPYFFY